HYHKNAKGYRLPTYAPNGSLIHRMMPLSARNPMKSSYSAADESSKLRELHRSSMSWQMLASTSLPRVPKEYAEHVKLMCWTAISITAMPFLMTRNELKTPACSPAFRAACQNAWYLISKDESKHYYDYQHCNSLPIYQHTRSRCLPWPQPVEHPGIRRGPFR